MFAWAGFANKLIICYNVIHRPSFENSWIYLQTLHNKTRCSHDHLDLPWNSRSTHGPKTLLIIDHVASLGDVRTLRQSPGVPAAVLRSSMEEKHTQILGWIITHFQSSPGFSQKRELTHCQNLTRCYSCQCYSTFSESSQLFCRHKRTEYHKLWFTTLINSVTNPSGNIRRITICKQPPNSAAKQRESVLLWWALFNVWVICLFYKQTSQIFRSNWKQYISSV